MSSIAPKYPEQLKNNEPKKRIEDQEDFCEWKESVFSKWCARYWTECQESLINHLGPWTAMYVSSFQFCHLQNKYWATRWLLKSLPTLGQLLSCVLFERHSCFFSLFSSDLSWKLRFIMKRAWNAQSWVYWRLNFP